VSSSDDLSSQGAGSQGIGGDITEVGVVGGGQMGAGIAEVCLRAGLDVIVREIDGATAEKARERIEKSLRKAASSGKLTADEAEAALGRLTCTDDWNALADRRMVIEAIIEDERLKTETFSRLDEVVRSSDAVLATNTSSLPISRIAHATSRPESVIGMHFFNPVPVLRLVELVPSLRTDEQTKRRAYGFAESQLGKQPIWCTDRAGFVVNALLIPYLLSAIRMAEAGVATPEDIDTGMVAGCAHPMGPLRLTDLIGLDTTKAVAESLYEEFAEPLYAPPPLLSRMVEAGLLGRKSGRGFYTYH
jgi:3-hydroxybutyryl-CoA dehydrogenase